jgi:hypothetical protein
MSQPSDKISSAKAKEMLRDGTAHGHPLTKKQKGMLGTAAGRAHYDHAGGALTAHVEPGLEPPDPGHPEPAHEEVEHFERQMGAYIQKHHGHLPEAYGHYSRLFHHGAQHGM